MKFICLGYADESKWNNHTPAERDSLIEQCFAYDDELVRKGHIVGGNALQSVRTAVTLRDDRGRAVATNGPYAETKEQIGGILIIEARDMNQAVELMSKHPGLWLGGPWEIRPAEESIEQMWNERRARVAREKAGG